MSKEEKESLLASLQKGDRQTVAAAMQVTPEYVSMVWAGKRNNERLWRVTRRLLTERQQFIKTVRCA